MGKNKMANNADKHEKNRRSACPEHHADRIPTETGSIVCDEEMAMKSVAPKAWQTTLTQDGNWGGWVGVCR